MKNSDMPVSPVFNSNGVIKGFSDDEGFTSMATGLSKREAFALAAMQGLCANQYNITTEDSARKDLVKEAVNVADALLNELSKEQS
jgi:hypothetical protein